MLKSNNHNCQPDAFGRKKGEDSPFFHIISSDRFLKIIDKKGLDVSFVKNLSVPELNTIFHKEARAEFLDKAECDRQERLTAAMETDNIAAKMREHLSALCHKLRRNTDIPLAHASAQLTLLINESLSEFRNNYLFFLHNHCNISESENRYFHIEKLLLCIELVSEYDPSIDKTDSMTLLEAPPCDIVKKQAKLIELALLADKKCKQGAVAIARAAKQKDTKDFDAALECLVYALHDIISLLNSYTNEV